MTHNLCAHHSSPIELVAKMNSSIQTHLRKASEGVYLQSSIGFLGVVFASNLHFVSEEMQGNSCLLVQMCVIQIQNSEICSTTGYSVRKKHYPEK